MLLLLAACAAPPVPSPDADPVVSPPGTTAVGEARSLTLTPGTYGPSLEARVTTDLPAPVAVRCESDAAPGEVHLAESTGGTDHVLHLSGLLADATWRCRATSTAPGAEAAPVEASLTLPPAPSSLPTATVTVDPDLGMTGVYTLFDFMPIGGCSREHWLVILDDQGRLRWWYPLPGGVAIDVEARWSDALGALVWGGGESPEGNVRIVDLWAGELDAGHIPGWEDADFHHDGKLLSDGRMLTLRARDVAVPEGTATGWAIERHDPLTDVVDWTWTTDDALADGLPTYGDGDAWHANWTDLVTVDGHEKLYVSLCWVSTIVRVDVETRRIDWIFSPDSGWTVTDPAGNVLPDDVAYPQCQHGLEVEDGGDLLVYDNGQDRGSSRALGLRLDGEAKQAQLLWTWAEDGWFEWSLGDIDRLPGGRVLITEAHPQCWSTNPMARSAIVELDPGTSQVASRVTFDSPLSAIYRSERLDGCAVFGSSAACPAVAARVAEVFP